MDSVITNYDFYKDRVFVINPDNGKLIKPEEWLKDEDPSRAQLVAVKTDYYYIVLSKKYLPGKFDFEGAQKATAEFKVEDFNHVFSCARRNVRNYIYDAYWSVLDSVLQSIGGDKLEEWEWTCEKDSWSCSRYVANFAWFFSGIGCAGVSSLNDGFRALPVVLLNLDELEAA